MAQLVAEPASYTDFLGHRGRSLPFKLAAAFAIVLSIARAALAQDQQASRAQDLKRLSIEELSEIDVTSVSRRAEHLADTAAAVSVVRQDDIRRSGVTTLAEAIRLADAIDVARIDSATWGISARGFNTNPANKLLVLIDGRSIYSQLFSGTFWDAEDLLLADIDRIEVIRGPGGTIWGANAVNGVVNIITRESAASQGNIFTVASGTDEHLITSGRHGGRLGSAGSYRVYGKYRNRGPIVFSTGDSTGESIQFGQGGFRLDSNPKAPSRWLIQGDLYKGAEGLFGQDDTVDIAGGNVLGRWWRDFAGRGALQAQASYEHTGRTVPQQFVEHRDTYNLDVQHRMTLGSRHDLVFGGAAQVTHGDDLGIGGFFFEPRVRTSSLVSLFVQDEFPLAGKRLFATIGSKFEHNDFTGIEPQPTVRLRWVPNDRQTLWGAVSRAVRLPTRFDTDLRIVGPPPIRGTEDFESEKVVAYEIGYRVRPHAIVSLDVAAYVNHYDDLRSTELALQPAPVIVLQNRLNAKTGGVEVAGTVKPAEWWNIHGSYAWLHKALTFDPGSTDVFRGVVEGNDPSHLFSLRSFTDLGHGLAGDALFRHVSSRPNTFVPAYSELDLRLGWKPRDRWELSVVGQNLLHDHHAELFTVNSAQHFEFTRGVYLRSVWQF